MPARVRVGGWRKEKALGERFLTTGEFLLAYEQAIALVSKRYKKNWKIPSPYMMCTVRCFFCFKLCLEYKKQPERCVQHRGCFFMDMN